MASEGAPLTSCEVGVQVDGDQLEAWCVMYSSELQGAEQVEVVVRFVDGDESQTSSVSVDLTTSID